MKQLGYIIACFVIIFNVQLVKAQGDVKIGSQIWTSKNLDVSTFRNGEAIPQAKKEVYNSYSLTVCPSITTLRRNGHSNLRIIDCWKCDKIINYPNS